MTNTYFNHVANRVGAGTRALDSQINNIADEIALGFDKLPSESDLNGNTGAFAANVGTVSAMVVNLDFTPVLTDGFNFYVRTLGSSSGPTTLNLNSLGVKNVRASDGSTLTDGSIAAGIIHLAYNATLDQYDLISNNSNWGKPIGTASTSPTEYCPGYTFNFISGTSFSVVGFDLENLLNVGRRLRFIDGVDEYFGTILTSTFVTDTTITMSMEGGDVLTNTITEFCLTTGTAGWSPIVGDPFGGFSINDIASGNIGATTFWCAVGDGGKIAFSSDKGVNWSIRTTVTTENINVCIYDSINEEFHAGGNAGVLLKSVDGIAITEDTTSIPGLAGSSNFDINGLAYAADADVLILLYHSLVTQWTSADSSDQAASWTARAALGNIETGVKNIEAIRSIGNAPNNFYYAGLTANTASRVIISSTDVSWGIGDNLGAGNVPSAFGFFGDGGQTVRLYGTLSGNMIGIAGWIGDDTATFSERIRDIAYSPLNDRLVCVGNNAQIGYLEAADEDVNDAWVFAQSGFTPLTNINAVEWNDLDGIFIAVSSTGQICRSTNGIN